MSLIIQIRLKKTVPSTFLAIRHFLLSEHTSLGVVMITWHLWAAVFRWEAYKQWLFRMSGSWESLLSRLYARPSKQRPHGDYYSYSVYFLQTYSAEYEYTVRPTSPTE